MWIPLTHGQFALIDKEDFERISQYRWIAARGRAGKWYAVASGVRPTLSMHRFLSGNPEGMEVDHVDGDSLNNTRANLRTVTHSQNMANQKTPSTNTSGYRGVSFDRSRGQWLASIRYQGRLIHIGRFFDAEQAARAYDYMAVSLFGEYARPNFE